MPNAPTQIPKAPVTDLWSNMDQYVETQYNKTPSITYRDGSIYYKFKINISLNNMHSIVRIVVTMY